MKYRTIILALPLLAFASFVRAVEYDVIVPYRGVANGYGYLNVDGGSSTDVEVDVLNGKATYRVGMKPVSMNNGPVFMTFDFINNSIMNGEHTVTIRYFRGPVQGQVPYATLTVPATPYYVGPFLSEADGRVSGQYKVKFDLPLSPPLADRFRRLPRRIREQHGERPDLVHDAVRGRFVFRNKRAQAAHDAKMISVLSRASP